MNELLIIRHAKSSWANDALSDYDRPLNGRGQRDAPRMGRWLVQQSLVPDLIVSSTAKRAWETTQLISSASGCTTIEWDDNLYHASAGTCVERLNEVPTNCKRVAVIAHNPGLEHLVGLLSGEMEFMPTAATAHLLVDVAWPKLCLDTRCPLEQVWRPKELPAEFE